MRCHSTLGAKGLRSTWITSRCAAFSMTPRVGVTFGERLRIAVAYAKEHQGEPAKSGAMYGFGGTPQGNATLEAVMAGVLDAMHDVAPAG